MSLIIEDCPFQPGDRIVIRDWDDMKAEYGTEISGSINVDNVGVFFVSAMRDLCGNEYTVDRILIRNVPECPECYVLRLCNFGFSWTITSGMCRRAEPEPDLQVSADDFLRLLLS